MRIKASLQKSPGPHAALAAFLVVAAGFRQAPSWAEDNSPYPQTSPPISERSDLSDKISGTRPLSLEDLNVLLGLSQFVACTEDESNRNQANLHWALRDLGRLGHAYAVPALLAVIRNEEISPGLRIEAVTALSRIRDKRVVDHLIDMLDDYDMSYAANIQLINITAVKIGNLAAFSNMVNRRKIQNEWRTWWNKNRERASFRRGAYMCNVNSPDTGLARVPYFTPEEWSPLLLQPRPDVPRENQ